MKKTAEISSEFNDTWYIDSGSSRHMTGRKDHLGNYVKVSGPTVTFGDNSHGITKGIGTICRGKVEIKDVFYVKGLKFNLLSISQFCDKGYGVEFTSNTCYIKDA